MLVIRQLPGGAAKDLENTAKELERSMKNRATHMLLRQKNTEQDDVNVQCLSVVKLDRTARKMADDGYGVGPPPGPELLLREGQELLMRFRGNICDSLGRKELRIPYNSNIKTRWDFRCSVVDRFAQKAIDCYRGFVQIYAKPDEKTAKKSTQPPKPTDDSKSQLKSGSLTRMPSSNQLININDIQPMIGDFKLMCELLVNLPKVNSIVFQISFKCKYFTSGCIIPLNI